MEKDEQYSVFLWIAFAVLIILHLILELLSVVPSSLRFLFIFIDFFAFLAGIFAVYYSYIVLEKVLKRRKKRKMALKSKDESERT